ncbi:MAG: glycosyltransferase [Deltaproteobacteria bacterium]|nr:glycosyltransferase [Deltaproteobacteria bacterium]
MDKGSLSLCMIFKNEALYLEEAIRSVLPIASECILIDSGSQDGSEKIVFNLQKNYPSTQFKYIKREWPGDFSNQRNFAIEQASQDWILFLDADERISSEDYEIILKSIQEKEVFAYDLSIRNYTYDTSELEYQPSSSKHFPYGFVPTKLHRLFRRDLKIRYSGILHERIEPSLLQYQLKTKSLNAVIHHLGRLKEKDHQLESERYAFYEILGQKKIEENPQDAQAQWELGVILLKQGRPEEARSYFSKAMTLAPEVEDFQIYYALSLFKQAKWNELEKFNSPHMRANFFSILAKAQTQPQMIKQLDNFRDSFSQASLFIFELSLRHHQVERLSQDRKLAEEIFSATGLVEFLEGSFYRSESQWDKAIPLLSKSLEKKCDLAIHDLALALCQSQRTKDATKLFENLTERQRNSLRADTLKIFAYAEAVKS